jgi:2-phosphosulfolactate phosphatase
MGGADFCCALHQTRVVPEDSAYHRQSGFDVRCEWGPEGVQRLAPDSDVVVIVDVLSFTTSVDIAVARGAVVFPYRFRDASAVGYAREHDALLAEQNDLGLSLKPHTLERIEAGCRLVMPSPNGSTLTTLTGSVPTLAGCLRNAPAVARRARELGRRIAVIPAGERWPEDTLRPSLEDWLGAGAILSELAHLAGESRSPEAEAAAALFEITRPRLVPAIWDCVSGGEKKSRGFERDLELASDYGVSDCAPLLDGPCYRAS